MAPARTPRIFEGARLRALRARRGWGQRQMAEVLGISVSYLSQLESDDRPLTPTLLRTLAARLPDEWATLDGGAETAMIVRATHAAADRNIADAVPADVALERSLGRHPALARRLVALHEAVARTQEQLRALNEHLQGDGGEHGSSPWQEVRDWFHLQRNYIDPIDRAAEALADQLPAGAPASAIGARLTARFGVEIVAGSIGDPTLRAYDPVARRFTFDPSQAPETTAFSLATLLARLEIPAIAAEVAQADLGAEARRLLTAGLVNYAAGALMMPYMRFRDAARRERHDIDRLRLHFGSSFEQTCHRLSTLQRPGANGLPFFFCRIDMAGNITKRHSATRLQFARFGGACPLWGVHEAAAIPDRILVQLAATPDGARYVSIAKGLVKASGGFTRTPRRYAVALGCEVEHARDFVYADQLALDGAATPIGTSCRICPRTDCEQRAFPPAASTIRLDEDRRGIVPYTFR